MKKKSRKVEKLERTRNFQDKRDDLLFYSVMGVTIHYSSLFASSLFEVSNVPRILTCFADLLFYSVMSVTIHSSLFAFSLF